MKGQEQNRPFFDKNNGSLLYISQYESVKGSQFLHEEWMQGEVITGNGAHYKNVLLKFDVYGNKMIFNRNDTSLEIDPAPREIRLFPTKQVTDTAVFRSGFTINPRIRPTTYLQVLAEGDITLLKYIHKDIEEYTEYGDATKFKRFVEMYQYFVPEKNGYQEIKISRKEMESLLQDRWQAIASYLSVQKLNGRDEKSWIMALKYYNAAK